MLKHTPYDGSHPLFKIGLEPLDLKDWIEVDDQLPHYLAEKERLLSERSGDVLVGEPGTETAQNEVLEMLVSHLRENFADIYHFDAENRRIEIPSAGVSVELDDASAPDLKKAALLVQEDLVIMRKGEAGWRLAAACLCFPSSWNLLEKFSRPLHDIHETVPGFSAGTRNASMIERIFDNIKVELPMRRFNWSVYSDDELFHDDRSAEHLERRHLAEGAFLRVEHQTLRKLPKSGDILFTVRIHIDPLAVLEERPDRAELAKGFIHSLRSLTADELDYKGLAGEVEGLIRKLDAIAAGC